MSSGSGAGGLRPAINKTIYFDADLHDAVEDMRSRKRPIISFSNMVNRLVRQALAVEKEPGQPKESG